MNREVHVRFWESLGVRFPWATQLCVTNTTLDEHGKGGLCQGRDALPKMGEGPPGSACRSRPQTTTSCWGDSALVVSVAGKGAAGRTRQVRSMETNESEPADDVSK